MRRIIVLLAVATLMTFGTSGLWAQTDADPGATGPGAGPGTAGGGPEIDEDIVEEVSLPAGVAGRVNDQEITARRVLKELTESSAHKRNMLMDIVQRMLVEAEAKTQNVAVFPNDLEQARAKRIESVGGPDKYVEMVRKGRIDPDLEEKQLRYQILLRKLIERDPEARVTDEEVRQAFERQHAERYNLQVILVGGEEAGRRAGDVYAQLTKGADFGLMAAKFSQHPSRQNAGILANVPPESLPEVLRPRVMALKKDAFTEPISHEGGVWIVKKLEHIPATPDADFAAERPKIEAFLKQVKMRQLAQSYMARLARKHKVQINKDLFANPDFELE